MTLPKSLSHADVDVPTPDGAADAYLVRPAGDATVPAVLMFMDAIGLRPRMREMADRVAERGCAVLVPNLFYRGGRAPVVPDVVERLQGEDRGTVFEELGPFMSALTPEVSARDTQAFVDFLDAQPGIDASRLLTVGYCMGGNRALRAAAQLGDRVVAAASFHGGNLAPDEPDGAQHGAPRIRGEVYAAHADADPSMPAEQIARLEQALTDAGVTHTSELYEGAHHGWTMSDMPVHDAAGEQRHWDALLELVDRTLVGADPRGAGQGA